MAVQNSDILPYLLGIGAFSYAVIKSNLLMACFSEEILRGVLIGCYSFFISIY